MSLLGSFRQTCSGQRSMEPDGDQFFLKIGNELGPGTKTVLAKLQKYRERMGARNWVLKNFGDPTSVLVDLWFRERRGKAAGEVGREDCWERVMFFGPWDSRSCLTLYWKSIKEAFSYLSILDWNVPTPSYIGKWHLLFYDSSLEFKGLYFFRLYCYVTSLCVRLLGKETRWIWRLGDFWFHRMWLCR